MTTYQTSSPVQLARPSCNHLNQTFTESSTDCEDCGGNLWTAPECAHATIGPRQSLWVCVAPAHSNNPDQHYYQKVRP